MAAVTGGIEALRAASVGVAAADCRSSPAPAAGMLGDVFRREGDYWTVRYQGSVVRLKDAKGLRHLARLLANPAREFHAVDLESADSPAALRAATARGRPTTWNWFDLGDVGELLDAIAKAAYKARIEELRTELEEAEGFTDPARAAKARVELDFLVAELARAVGWAGATAWAAAHAERARLNATRAIAPRSPTSPASTPRSAATWSRRSGPGGTARTRPTPGFLSSGRPDRNRRRPV